MSTVEAYLKDLPHYLMHEKTDTEQHVDVVRTMRRLDVEDRRMLFLHYVCGFSEREIAKQLHLTRWKVRKMISGARTRLEGLL